MKTDSVRPNLISRYIIGNFIWGQSADNLSIFTKIENPEKANIHLAELHLKCNELSGKLNFYGSRYESAISEFVNYLDNLSVLTQNAVNKKIINHLESEIESQKKIVVENARHENMVTALPDSDIEIVTGRCDKYHKYKVYKAFSQEGWDMHYYETAKLHQTEDLLTEFKKIWL